MIDVINAVISESSYSGSCRMLATRLAETFRCERAVVGQHRNKKSAIVAIFQSASFERKQELGTAIEAAMDEAIDQSVALITPAPPSSSFVAAAQETLSKLNDKAAILTVPIMHRDLAVGAVVLERFSGEMFTPGRARPVRRAVRRERTHPGRQAGARLGPASDRGPSRDGVRQPVLRRRPSRL